MSSSAIWPGSLLRVESIVGVVETSDAPPRDENPSKCPGRGSTRPDLICVNSDITLRYLICSSAVNEREVMRTLNSVLSCIGSAIDYPPLTEIESEKFGATQDVIYESEESSANRAPIETSIARSEIITPVRRMQPSGETPANKRVRYDSSAGFTNANTFRDSYGFHIPLENYPPLP